jgi:hypothetical protein
VSELVGAVEHQRKGFDCRDVQGDDTMARLVLAAAHVQQLLHEIHVHAPQVFDFDRTHRRVGRHDRSAVHMFPFRVRSRGIE